MIYYAVYYSKYNEKVDGECFIREFPNLAYKMKAGDVVGLESEDTRIFLRKNKKGNYRKIKADNPNIGRKYTLQFVHLSEAGFYIKSLNNILKAFLIKKGEV